MSQLENWEINQLKRIQGAIIGHGALILFIGLVAGVMLTFAMLNGIKIWPFGQFWIFQQTFQVPFKAGKQPTWAV